MAGRFSNGSFLSRVCKASGLAATLFFLLSLMPQASVAQLTPSADMVLDSNALWMGNTGNFSQGINGKAHQSEPLISFGGYQFATWYQNGANNEQHIFLARRDLSDPTNTWQSFDTGYDMENGDEDGNGSGHGRWDSHNVIGMGISGDGRIHLAYDHHVDDLRYLTTRGINKATISNSAWLTQTADAANQFFVPGGERSKFNAQDSGNVTGITYPRFADGPNGDSVITYRIGGSGNGDTHFLIYNSDAVTNSNGVINQRWSGSHVVIDGNAGSYSDGYSSGSSGSRNAYLNGMDTGPDGKIHMTWTWREGSSDPNHDIMYAYSEDGGGTWKNNDGGVIANKSTGQTINLNSPGVTVVDLDRTQSVMNQQAQCVDADGRVHVLMWHRRDDGVGDEFDWVPGERFNALKSAYYHYHRDPATGDWTRNQLPTSRRVSTRPKIGYDFFGNVFAVYTSNSDLIVAGATKAANYADWTLLYEGTRNYGTDAILDQSRLFDDGVLSVFVQERGTSSSNASGTNLRVVEFNVAVSPTVTGIELNLGETQRSTVESVTVYFDGDVTLAPGAVSVVQRSTATAETFEAVSTSVSTQLVNGQTMASISFDSHVRNSANALVDGNYQITLNADLVTLDGVPMREDFVFGDVENDAFYAFFGDSDGNRSVDIFALLAFRQAYRSVSGNANYDYAVDYEANGAINIFDLLQFRTRYRETIPFTFTSKRSSLSGRSKTSTSRRGKLSGTR
jgi:hypothetical protein